MAKPLGILLQLAGLNAELAQELCIPERQPAPIDRADDALARGRIEFGDG